MDEISVLTTGAGIEVDLTEGLRELLLRAGAALVGVGSLGGIKGCLQECYRLQTTKFFMLPESMINNTDQTGDGDAYAIEK